MPHSSGNVRVLEMAKILCCDDVLLGPVKRELFHVIHLKSQNGRNIMLLNFD